jgi:hypothetical protein
MSVMSVSLISFAVEDEGVLVMRTRLTMCHSYLGQSFGFP